MLPRVGQLSNVREDALGENEIESKPTDLNTLS